MTAQNVDPLIGRLVDGRYRVRARIARGGMATVYVATDLRLERRVALKVMHGHLSDDSVFQSRFIQEARAAARLADPHVVNVFDQGQDGEIAYLVMEYLPGITLRDLLKEQRRLTVPQTVSIMDAVLAGLAAAHRASIVHRDVKPENVLLAEDGRIKIGDFGLARATSANTATGQQLMGTIAYLAPELVTRGTADARSDIYALGIMLYEMLTGEQPYRGEQPMQIAFQHATESVPRPSRRNPAVPEQLDELVLWATEKDPEERPLDAQVMLDRLREIERDLDITPAPSGGPPTGATSIIEEFDSIELTRVLPNGGNTAPTDPVTGPVATVDNAARLRRVSARRSRRGTVLVLLTILLAAVAGGAGWWFGSGPGSMISVPSITEGDFATAQAQLAELTLVAVEQPQPSLEVAAGTVIGTDPSGGTLVDKNATVTVIVSTGPQEVTVEPLVGMTEGQVGEILKNHAIAVTAATQEFSDVTEGNVMVATIVQANGGEPVACIDGCTVHAGDTAELIVSLGTVPNVSDISVDDARKSLQQRNLVVSDEIVEQYSNDVELGRVIGIAEREGGGNWRPTDTVTLIVSLGPEPVPVPDVSGLTRDEAAAELQAAGFEYGYANSYEDIFGSTISWGDVPNGRTRVIGQDPSGEAVPGTVIQLTLEPRGLFG